MDPVEIETNRDKMWQKVLDLAKQLKENMDEYEKHQADLEKVIWIFLNFDHKKVFSFTENI
jgi:hypothetical protein